MRVLKLTAFLGVILLLLSLFSGCRKAEDYVGDLDEKLAQTRRLEDELLVKVLNNAVTALILAQASKGQDTMITWDGLKKHLDENSITYLENLGGDCLSHKTLPNSIRDGGWLKVRQGWITISQGGELNFAFTMQKP